MSICITLIFSSVGYYLWCMGYLIFPTCVWACCYTRRSFRLVVLIYFWLYSYFIYRLLVFNVDISRGLYWLSRYKSPRTSYHSSVVCNLVLYYNKMKEGHYVRVRLDKFYKFLFDVICRREHGIYFILSIYNSSSLETIHIYIYIYCFMTIITLFMYESCCSGVKFYTQPKSRGRLTNET